MPESLASSYYNLLGITPSASTQQIRRAYRELSKLYHPDTTTLPPAIATAKFQQLNQAYATLCNPDQRMAYDLKNGYSRIPVIQPLADLNQATAASRKYRSSAYLEPVDRPLSPGELFALFILGLTFAACLVLVVTVGLTRGDIAFRSLTSPQATEILPASSPSPPETFSSEVSTPEVSTPEALPAGALPTISSLEAQTPEALSLEVRSTGSATDRSHIVLDQTPDLPPEMAVPDAPTVPLASENPEKAIDAPDSPDVPLLPG